MDEHCTVCHNNILETDYAEHRYGSDCFKPTAYRYATKGFMSWLYCSASVIHDREVLYHLLAYIFRWKHYYYESVDGGPWILQSKRMAYNYKLVS
jgi:hypothetical protein